MQSYFDNPYAVALRRDQQPKEPPTMGGGYVGGTRLFNPNGEPVVQRQQSQGLSSDQSEMLMKGLKKYGQSKGWFGGAPAYSNLATTGAGSSAAMTNAMLAAPAGSSASAGYGLYSGAPIGAQAAGFGGWSSGLGAAGTGAEAGLYGGGAASAGGLGGGAGATGGGAAAAGGGGALAATGWGALLAAVIALNEKDSRKRGLRADSSSERHKDLWTGKSFPQDMQGKWGPMFDRWSNGSFSKIGGTDFATSAGQAAFGRFGPARKSFTSGLHRVGDVFQKIF